MPRGSVKLMRGLTSETKFGSMKDVSGSEAVPAHTDHCSYNFVNMPSSHTLPYLSLYYCPISVWSLVHFANIQVWIPKKRPHYDFGRLTKRGISLF